MYKLFSILFFVLICSSSALHAEDIPNKGVCIVEHWMNGCIPCQMLSTELAKIKDIPVVKIYRAPEIASFPTTIFYKDGVAQRVVKGYMSEETIRGILQELK